MNSRSSPDGADVNRLNLLRLGPASGPGGGGVRTDTDTDADTDTDTNADAGSDHGEPVHQ